MIRQWDVPEPQLVREPAQALAGLLDKMLPPENVGNRYRKQYFLRRIVRQLHRYAAIETDELERSVQAVLSNIRVSNYEAALQLGQNLWNNSLKSALAGRPLPTSALYCACDLMDAFWSITFGVTKPDRQNLLEFDAYTLCIEVAEALIALNKRSTPRRPSELREQLLNARLHRAVWLTEVTSATDDIAAKKALDPIAEFRDIFNRRARKFPVQASWALLNCGFVFAKCWRETTTAEPNSRGDTNLLSEAARCFKRVYTRYSPDIVGAAHRDGLIDPWLKAGCNLAIVYVERNDFKRAKAIAEAVLQAADSYIQADTGAIRDKAARIVAHCAHELVQRAPKVRRRKSPPDSGS